MRRPFLNGLQQIKQEKKNKGLIIKGNMQSNGLTTGQNYNSKSALNTYSNERKRKNTERTDVGDTP